MERSITTMSGNLRAVLGEDLLTLYLVGSVAQGDYRYGWSDIDILCLTQRPMRRIQLHKLLNLRRTLLTQEPENRYYKSFEG